MRNLFMLIAALLLVSISFWSGLKYASNNTTATIQQELFSKTGNVIMSEKEIKRLHKIYADYRDTVVVNGKKGDSSLTKYITMDKSVFQSIAAYINLQQDSSITGIRFIMIRYDTAYKNAIGSSGPDEFRVRGKIFPYQNSFAIVPMVNGKEDYSIFNSKSLKMLEDGGYNHGNLCPADCYGEN